MWIDEYDFYGPFFPAITSVDTRPFPRPGLPRRSRRPYLDSIDRHSTVSVSQPVHPSSLGSKYAFDVFIRGMVVPTGIGMGMGMG